MTDNEPKPLAIGLVNSLSDEIERICRETDDKELAWISVVGEIQALFNKCWEQYGGTQE